ncbi:MAG: BREX system ATP-binding domain-containing protein, partial [Deltaproteobacteria bacterium]
KKLPVMLWIHGGGNVNGSIGVVTKDDRRAVQINRVGSAQNSAITGIRQIIDAADRYKGLLWVFTGTPEFFDTRRGVAGLQPLHDRIQFLTEGGLVTMRQPQLQLKPFDRDRLKDVGLRLRQLYPVGDPNIVAQKVTPERIDAMVDEVSKGFGGDVGVVPRQFLRRLVNLFDSVAENPDVELPEPPASVEEKRAAEGKKPIEYEPEPDDDKGYSVTSVEF